ncbi:MAG: M20/M25/M40 family metallo-hydrolase [Lysobacterales bacterium]
MSETRIGLAIGLVLAILGTAPARAETAAQAMPETMDMLRHAIAMPTVVAQGSETIAKAQLVPAASKGQVPALAHYLAGKLESAGFAGSDIEIIPVDATAAMAVRYRGSDDSLKPILLSGHMDVVAANPETWGRDPFRLTREGPYLYGRGVADMKTNVVALVETFMRLKRAGYVPKRGMILLLSGDEETDMASTRELARRYHDAEFLLNADAGGGTLDPATGKPVLYKIQAAEKTYVDFLLTVTAPGGHSSEPNPKANAIDKLARALTAVANYPFPVQHNDITIASLKALGAHGTGPLAEAMRAFAANPDDAKAAATISADPAYVGQIRTTCIATQLDGGHARNALPSRATANINCRIFPGVPVADVEATLANVIANPDVKIAAQEPPPVESPASPLRPDVMDAVAATIHARYPGVEIVPGMSSGATDSMFFRAAGVPCYGVDPSFAKPDDTHAHGINERLLASEVPAALTYWNSLLQRLTK